MSERLVVWSTSPSLALKESPSVWPSVYPIPTEQEKTGRLNFSANRSALSGNSILRHLSSRVNARSQSDGAIHSQISVAPVREALIVGDQILLLRFLLSGPLGPHRPMLHLQMVLRRELLRQVRGKCE